eukprot:g4992.t1
MSGHGSSSDEDIMDVSLQEELDLSHQLVEEYEQQFTEMESERDDLLEKVKLRESEVVELKRRLSTTSVATSDGQLLSGDRNSLINHHSEEEEKITSEELLAHPLVQELRERFAFVSAENKRLREEFEDIRDKAQAAGYFLAEKADAHSVNLGQEQLLEAERSKNAILCSEVEALKLALVKLKEEYNMKIVNLTKVFERIAEASNSATDRTSTSVVETNENNAAQSQSSSSSESENDDEVDGVEGRSSRPAPPKRTQSKTYRSKKDSKKRLRRVRKDRLQSKQTSSQRGSFFGSSTRRAKQVEQMGQQKDGMIVVFQRKMFLILWIAVPSPTKEAY